MIARYVYTRTCIPISKIPKFAEEGIYCSVYRNIFIDIFACYVNFSESARRKISKFHIREIFSCSQRTVFDAQRIFRENSDFDETWSKCELGKETDLQMFSWR